MEPNFELLPRIGTFFLLMGGGLMILFIGSEFSREANFNYFFLGLVTLFFGIIFRRRAKPRENARFASIRKARERRQQRKLEKQKKVTNKK